MKQSPTAIIGFVGDLAESMKDQFIVQKIIFIAACLSISACLQVFVDDFIYWQAALFQEPWRIWTGHWVHVGWIHYLLNMAAFACLPFIFYRTKIWHFVSLLIFLPPMISLCFYLYLPNIEAYAGLSGVLHGIYISIAIIHLFYKRDRGFATVVLLLILAKVVWENTWGNSSTAELIGSSVLTEAHLLGIIFGVLLAIVYIVAEQLIQRFHH